MFVLGQIVLAWGLLQPFADTIKLLTKEIIVPTASNRFLFIIAPMISFGTALIGWAVIPFDQGVVLANINAGVLYTFCDFIIGCLWHYDCRLGI